MNTRAVSTPPIFTEEGGKAKKISAKEQLRRLTLATLLWEDNFYIDGKSLVDFITESIGANKPVDVAAIAVEAREKQHLRHLPLLMVRELARMENVPKGLVRDTLSRVIQRADEIAEFLAIYWADGKIPLASQIKKGLSDAFNKFNAYQFAKYDRANAIKLRDVAFLVHPKPVDKEHAEIFARMLNKDHYPSETKGGFKVKQKLRLGEFAPLDTPDTWETSLSAGEGKKTTAEKKKEWTRLLDENKLGAMALIRNLRNMTEASVDDEKIRKALAAIKPEKVLPFRFIAAARHASKFERELEAGMFICLEGMPKLTGKTVLLVDVSGSMEGMISGKSEISRLDAGCGLAMLVSELAKTFQVYTFSEGLANVPPRRGFALAEGIKKSQSHGGTFLGDALTKLYKATENIDRLIVITDEQSHDQVSFKRNIPTYVINVAANKNGIGYGTGITHIDGWSEAVIDFIQKLEESEE
jgi:60 kDa SS-A/Ro ribonucleoprotein